MKELRDKVVVITGAGSGIGKSLALQFAALGSKLALNDFNESRLKETVAACEQKGADVFSSHFDVSNRDDFYAFAENVVTHFNQVDVVINNAGVALGKYTIEEATIEDFEWIFGINFWGVLYGTKAFLPHLKRRSEAAIVNISSLFGITGVAHQGAYCATKFAVRGLTESLRMEMQNSNVRVHVVHPGGIKTNIAKDSKTHGDDQSEIIKRFEKGFRHTADVAAQVIIKGIRKKEERILIGEETYIGDMMVRLAPTYYTKVMSKIVNQFN